MLLFIRGSANSAFSGPARAPTPLSTHSLSHRQPGPACQPRRCATVEIEVRCPRASRLGRGRDAARRSEPGPTPPPRHMASPLLDPPLCCPPPPLKRSHQLPADLFLPRASFVSPIHARATHTLPPPPRRLPSRFSIARAPPLC
jgi:hypothetical protein